MVLKLLGTREQKKNKAGMNTETKALFIIFSVTDITKSKQILLGNTGTQGKFCWEQGREDPKLSF